MTADENGSAQWIVVDRRPSAGSANHGQLALIHPPVNAIVVYVYYAHRYTRVVPTLYAYTSSD